MPDLSHQAASPIDARVEEKKTNALKLRIRGLSYRKIAAELGIGKSQAHIYVTDALRETREQNAESAMELRELELQRLDVMQAQLTPVDDDDKATLDPRTADTILRIMERRAKLIGLDAPADTRVGGLPGAPLAVDHGVDLTRFTVDELRNFLQLVDKAQADPPT